MRVKLRVNEGGGGWVEWRSEGGGREEVRRVGRRKKREGGGIVEWSLGSLEGAGGGRELEEGGMLW